MLLREAAILRTYPPTLDTPIRAEFEALTAEESASLGRDSSAVTYRMTFRWPVVVPVSGTTVTWRGKQYLMVGPSMQHTVGGRLHHQEAIITRATG